MIQRVTVFRSARSAALIAALITGGVAFSGVIASDYRQKWGLSKIRRSGRIHVRLVNGKSREMILFGDSDPDSLRDRIVTTLGVGVTSAV